MTIHAQEHASFLRRLGDLDRELDAQIEQIDSLRQDLAQDDEAGTLVVREELRQARAKVGAALLNLDRARRDLPIPTETLLFDPVDGEWKPIPTERTP